jgi:hypothetical protein
VDVDRAALGVGTSQSTQRGEEWTSSNTTYRPIHPASILGTATVAYEINEALPFGPWTPGGPAAIVTDYRDTIDCDGAKTLSGPCRGRTRSPARASPPST